MSVEAVSYTYPGMSTPALKDTSLRLHAGERVALIGRNGCGKSTLFLHFNGILRPDRGEVQFGHEPVRYDRAGLLALRQRVGIVFQNPDEQLFAVSVAQDISFGPLNLGLSAGEARDRIGEAAELCGVADLLNRPTHALSGGQKRRVALAGVLAMRPTVLLADEALSDLDPPLRRQVLAVFDHLVAVGKTVVLATHDLDLARRWADRIVVMEGGQVVAEGTSGAVFADRSLLAQVGLLDEGETEDAD